MAYNLRSHLFSDTQKRKLNAFVSLVPCQSTGIVVPQAVRQKSLVDYSQLKLADKKQVALPQNAQAKSPVLALLVVQLFEATRTWLKDSQWKHSNFPGGEPLNCRAFQRNKWKQPKYQSSRNAVFLAVYPILSAHVCYPRISGATSNTQQASKGCSHALLAALFGMTPYMLEKS